MENAARVTTTAGCAPPFRSVDLLGPVVDRERGDDIAGDNARTPIASPNCR